jgi:hypothetical protein
MSDQILNKLNEVENNIIDFSEGFLGFLKRIREVVGGKSLGDSGTEELLEELIKNISTTKEHMHKYIDDIYTDTSFENKSKYYNDMREQLANIKDLNTVFNKLK